YRLAQTLAGDRTLFCGGDSAGGGLTLSYVTALRDEGSALPRAVILLSPWLNLLLNSKSKVSNDRSDAMVGGGYINRLADYYAGSTPKNHPKLSPLFADLHNLPPIQVLVSDSEV